MDEPVRITAVIPTYNREKTIGRAVDSVLAQEFPPCEIIVVDDGSKDGTRTVLEAYGDRVRHVYQPNGGVSTARNLGVKEAKYDWIAFLDSDDYWSPGHLRRMAEAIRETKAIAALYFCDLQLGREEGGGSYWQLCDFKINTPFEFKHDAGDWAFIRIQPMMFQASVIRKNKYLESGGLPADMRTREDTLMFFKFGLLYPACAVSGCGTVMMDDGATRLTQDLHTGSLAYSLATVRLFKELLAMGTPISSKRLKLLIDELGGANFSLGRAYYRQKMYSSSVRSLARAAITSPTAFISSLLDSFGRRFFQRPPPRHGRQAQARSAGA